MLPSTVEDFTQPVWVPVPELNGEGNEVAEVKVIPYTYDDVCEVNAKFGICTNCDGSGMSNGSRCPLCADKPHVRQSDPQVRQYVLARHLLDWRKLFVFDQRTGTIRELPFSATARDGIAKVLPGYLAILNAATKAGAVLDAAKKDSAISPQDDSDTDRASQDLTSS